MRVFQFIVWLLIIININASIISAQTFSKQDETLEGRIIEVRNESQTDPTGQEYLYQKIDIEIYRGSLAGDTITVINDPATFAGAPEYQTGDQVMITSSQHIDGSDVFYITDYVRRDGLLLLFILFAGLAVAVGGKWGAASLIGMALSFLVIFKFILPQILAGRDAVTIAVIGSSIIIPITFTLSHGFKTKTWIAGLGTIVTLVITGLAAALFANLAHLTGFGSEEAGFIQFQFGQTIDLKGLFLAGMIISSLGILDDITISQASIVNELKQANPKYKFPHLFTKAMNVGRDHIASLINTLILVYAGASLPLLLLFTDNTVPFSEVINTSMIAEEIVRTLIGSIGLILAVPITTFLAAWHYRR